MLPATLVIVRTLAERARNGSLPRGIGIGLFGPRNAPTSNVRVDAVATHDGTAATPLRR